MERVKRAKIIKKTKRTKGTNRANRTDRTDRNKTDKNRTDKTDRNECISNSRKEAIIFHSSDYFTLIFFILSILSICMLFSPPPAYTGTIWRIGINDDTNNEFTIPSSDTVTYWVLDDWGTRVDWTPFPIHLCPPNSPIPPKQINITYTYQRDYQCLVLRVKARLYGDPDQELIVIKGDDQFPARKNDEASYRYALFEIPLGSIHKGDNTIILKNQALSDTGTILFDYLELVDQDQDGDCSCDDEEGKGDIDGDGLPNNQDSDTAALVIKNHDQLETKRITLDLREQEDSPLFFQKVSLIDQNSPDFPPGLPEDVFFSYGIFEAKIEVSNEENLPEEQLPSRELR